MSNRWDFSERIGLGRAVRARRLGPALVVALGFGVGAVAGPANAQVFQTDSAKTPLPQPVGTTELTLTRSSFGWDATTASYRDPSSGALLDTPIIFGQYYAPPAFPQYQDGDEINLSGLFKWRGEKIDPIANATTGPGHFFPGCGFTAELVLRGGGCTSGLGWYNYTGDAAPPAASDIHPLVPGDPTYLHEIYGGIFAPLGWDNRNPRNLSELAWTPQHFDSGMITSNADYAGGDIAFALIGDPITQCSQNKYSVYAHNTKNTSGVPWVTALIYRSTVDRSAIYLAFEDLPMSSADWRVTNGTGVSATIDGDFNDFVFYISGLGATSTCPDPVCKSVTCDAGSVCSAGVCVPSGSSGGEAGAGGADDGIAGETSSGGVGTSSGGVGTSSGGVGTSSGGANMSNGGVDTSDGGADASNSDAGNTAVSAGSGGTSNTGAGGTSGSSDQTSKACSCRLGARPTASHEPWLGLALGAAFFARRRRNQRVLRSRTARASDPT
jgi:MYXO-CTERM domain-containing protein